MIRLTVLLSAGIFVMLLVLGEDRGQRRQGLMVADTDPLLFSPVVEAAPEPVEVAAEPLNLPDQPVIQTSFEADPVAEAVAAEVAAQVSVPVEPVVEEAVVEVTAATPAETTEGQLRWIDATSVNVREGPSTEFAVMGRLTRGEAVLVVLEEGGSSEGWSRVRIEGDGVEGFVATRLLTDTQP